MNSGKICVSVCAQTADELIAKVRTAAALADVVEVRFDCLAPSELLSAMTSIRPDQFTIPLIAALMPVDQGGKRQMTMRERVEFWQALPAGWWADEPGVYETNCRIASYHEVDGEPKDPVSLYRFLQAMPADVIKIAFASGDASDGITVWKLMAQPHAFVPIAMGEAGKWTRILGLAHGAYMTYAALDAGEETAAGQLTVDDVQRVYRVKDLDRSTQVYGVIGDPVSSSFSPLIHNAAFASLGINSVFIPLQVKNLDAFICRMVSAETRELDLNFAGFAVTMPHKVKVMKYLDHIDEDAVRVGAVNTIKIEADKSIGYNTDVEGCLEPLKARYGELSDAKVLVIGAGGAARACIAGLQDEGAEVTVAARDETKAKVLSDDLAVRVIPLSQVKGQSPKIEGHPFDIIVNATPVGMAGPLADDTPLTAPQLAGVKFVFDLVTRIDKTPLMIEAEAAGVPSIGGAEMLLTQAAKQFEIWTGRQAPVDIMRGAIS